MSFKHVGTAADLVRFGASLRIECAHCAAANTLSAAEVVRRCGPSDLERSAAASNAGAAAGRPPASWCFRRFSKASARS
jgi:hypothetical protein